MRLAHEVVTNHSDIERASSHRRGKFSSSPNAIAPENKKPPRLPASSTPARNDQERIDELQEWFMMPERRGAYTAESPDRHND
jgi:hypothetical protein